MQIPDAGGGWCSILTAVDRAASRYNGGYSPLQRLGACGYFLSDVRRLESLDVRRCFDLHLEGDLGKRCRQRMKRLKLPHDSVSDVPWPNWDGRDPFGPDAYFDDYEYNYYQDGEDYFSSEEDEDDEDVLSEDDEDVLSEEGDDDEGVLSEEDEDENVD
ncbi:hypothetical protein SASPL_124447 [Salvia splendens]|uniref:Uncharacterized protein n=1 Tax=Salvia splendens TaxID=180675 RepID=A0A8X8XMW3_SALSN|nr:hypothetical protein SASPL_124447 [Salvia splendens]